MDKDIPNITFIRLLGDYIKSKYNVRVVYFDNAKGRNLVIYENLDNGKVITKDDFDNLMTMNLTDAKLKIEELFKNG